jgi:hypothetical protein
MRLSQWYCWRLQSLFDMMSCHWVCGSWCFKEMWSLHHQGLLGLLDPEEEGIKTLWMRSNLNSDTASLSWRPDSSFIQHLEFTVSLHTMEKWTKIIQINQPTRSNSFTSLFLEVYVWLNMFRVPLHPSSGANNRTSNLWFYRWRVAAAALLVVVCYRHFPMVKPEVASIVVCSWWWVERRPKHVEPHVNVK